MAKLIIGLKKYLPKRKPYPPPCSLTDGPYPLLSFELRQVIDERLKEMGIRKTAEKRGKEQSQ